MSGLLTYNTIVVSENPRGRFIEGIVDGTPKPGTVMQLKAGTAKSAGKFTFEAYSRDGDGNRPQGPLMVLTEDYLQGRLVTDAYTSGDQVKVYIPLPGDELLMLLQDVAGTGDDHTVGEILIADSGTGKLIATTGTPESEPFTLLEAITDPTADTLAHCWYSGF